MNTQRKNYWFRIVQLAWLDVRKSHRGALLGWAWLVVHPLIMLGLYWFIVAIGFKSNTVASGIYDYLPWLVAGLCAWFFIADAINGGTRAFAKYKFLVTKTKFPMATIPLIVLLSNLIVHGILLAIVIAYLAWNGYASIQWIQLPLYILLSVSLATAWSFLAAPLGAMSRDFSQLIRALMRMLIWVSGILWSVHTIDILWLKQLMLLNPITFIIEGYRKSLIYHEWMFYDWYGMAVFLLELGILACCAAVVYRRTHREVADVL